MHKYRLVAKKGEGTFSEVLKAQSVVTGEYFAVKCMKSKFKSLEQVHNLREIQALKRLNPNPHIIHMEEILFDNHTGRLALVFELMECNIYELIRGRTTYLKPQKIKVLMYQLLKAVAHMHSLGIFHRDIKPENILILGDQLKVADFGSCRGMYSKPPFTEYISTRWYRAPECLLTNGHYDYKMDMWGIGCVFYEVVSLLPLFPGTNELDQINQLHKVMGTPSEEVLSYFKKKSSHVNQFDFTPKKGSGIASLIPHASKDCINLIESLLAYLPSKRITAKHALQHPYFKDLREAEQRDRIRTASPVMMSHANLKQPMPSLKKIPSPTNPNIKKHFSNNAPLPDLDSNATHDTTTTNHKNQQRVLEKIKRQQRLPDVHEHDSKKNHSHDLNKGSASQLSLVDITSTSDSSHSKTTKNIVTTNSKKKYKSKRTKTKNYTGMNRSDSKKYISTTNHSSIGLATKYVSVANGSKTKNYGNQDYSKTKAHTQTSSSNTQQQQQQQQQQQHKSSSISNAISPEKNSHDWQKEHAKKDRERRQRERREREHRLIARMQEKEKERELKRLALEKNLRQEANHFRQVGIYENTYKPHQTYQSSIQKANVGNHSTHVKKLNGPIGRQNGRQKPGGKLRKGFTTKSSHPKPLVHLSVDSSIIGGIGYSKYR